MPLSIEEANKRLLAAPGGMFEMEDVTVKGVDLKSWKMAPKNLRQVLENTRNFFDRDYIVYEGERVTYEQNYHAVANEYQGNNRNDANTDNSW